jgi:hypothetical protein
MLQKLKGIVYQDTSKKGIAMNESTKLLKKGGKCRNLITQFKTLEVLSLSLSFSTFDKFHRSYISMVIHTIRAYRTKKRVKAHSFPSPGGPKPFLNFLNH